MKIRTLLKISATVFPILCFAHKPSFDSLTVDELWDKAEFVGIVTVEQGSYIESAGYALKGKVDLPLKGDPLETIEIDALYPLVEAPNELGQKYLLYLELNKEGRLVLISHRASVIKMFRSDPQDREGLEASIKSIQGATSIVFERGGYIWSTICYTKSRGNDCGLHQSSVEKAFNKALKTDAPKARAV